MPDYVSVIDLLEVLEDCESGHIVTLGNMEEGCCLCIVKPTREGWEVVRKVCLDEGPNVDEK